jgi:cystathionine beta-lyase
MNAPAPLARHGNHYNRSGMETVSAFDFDRIIDRRRPGCVKWTRYPDDVLPMWVADMDFLSPQPVRHALAERVALGLFGYEFPTHELAELICDWLARRHGWPVQPEAIVFLPGLVSGMNLVARAFGRVGDSALMLAPIYPPFFSVPANQGMTATTVTLRWQTEGQHLRGEVDDEAFARAIGPRTSLFLFCHPHNPTGHEWTRDELQRLADICLSHNVLICSDEIWGDLTLDGIRHTPLASLAPEIGQQCITLMSPSKTFNIPSLGFGFAVIENESLRRRFIAANNGVLPYPNAMGLAAAAAAYRCCDQWLDALRHYLTENRNVLLDYLAHHLPAVRTTFPDATYLAWLDFRATGLDDPHRFLLEKAHVALNDGASFGPGGQGFVRFNFGCPRAQMLEALERMRSALSSLG